MLSPNRSSLNLEYSLRRYLLIVSWIVSAISILMILPDGGRVAAGSVALTLVQFAGITLVMIALISATVRHNHATGRVLITDNLIARSGWQLRRFEPLGRYEHFEQLSFKRSLL